MRHRDLLTVYVDRDHGYTGESADRVADRVRAAVALDVGRGKFGYLIDTVTNLCHFLLSFVYATLRNMDGFPETREKQTWRAWAMERRSRLDVANALVRLQPRLAQLDEWQKARRVLFYCATAEEINVNGFLDEPGGKEWCLPRCASNRMLTIHPVTPDQMESLVTSRFGVREPHRESPHLAPETIDLVIVPALAFDERGYRLGYGGGYYDRFLPRLRPDCVTIGLTLDALVVPILPTEPHDIPVQIVVTERRVIRRADTTTPTPPPYSG